MQVLSEPGLAAATPRSSRLAARRPKASVTALRRDPDRRVLAPGGRTTAPPNRSATIRPASTGSTSMGKSQSTPNENASHQGA
jgi:hypothetical protein